MTSYRQIEFKLTMLTSNANSCSTRVFECPHIKNDYTLFTKPIQIARIFQSTHHLAHARSKRFFKA
ncbi:hypothetical protein H5410_004042, partial [Solanum commersonii]